MKNIIYILTITTLMLLVACGGGKKETNKHIAHSQTAQVVYYGCPMTEHSHNAAKEPGDCPECGMTMVAVVKTTDGDHDFYGCPMAEHSHVRQEGPGECSDCGMTYRPLKFAI